jgi:hypothetical protein
MVWAILLIMKTVLSVFIKVKPFPGRHFFMHWSILCIIGQRVEFNRGTFRVKGDTVDINLPYVDYGYRISFFGDEIEEIESIDVVTGKRIGKYGVMQPFFRPIFM